MKNWINKHGGWLIVAIAIFGPLTWLTVSASVRGKQIADEMDINKLPNGTRVYEVRHNGLTYVVVENHKGVGISSQPVVCHREPVLRKSERK